MRLLALALAVSWSAAIARADTTCEQRGPAYFACDKAQGGCRARLSDHDLEIKERGFSVSVKLPGFSAEARDVVVQPIAESVQRMREGIRVLVRDYNGCAISDADYRSREDELIGFRDTVRGEARRVEELVTRLDAVETLGETTEARIAELYATKNDLKAAVRKTHDLAARVDALARQQAGGVSAEVDARFGTVDAEIDRRASALAQRIADLEHTLAEIIAANSEGQLSSGAWVLNLAGGSTWLDGELRATTSASFETIRPADGFLSRLVLFYEASGVVWKRHDTFTTFPGLAPAPLDQEASFFAGQVGAKRYLAFRGVHLYAGVAAGFLAQPNDGWRVGLLAQPLAGIALAFSRARAGVELRYGFYAFHARYAEFDAFGDTRTGYRLRGRAAPTVIATLSPYSW